jgi:ubiquitin carboxyl-terminal hydrolase 4/11/15
MKYQRDFELIVVWNSSPQANLRPIESPDFDQVVISTGNTQSMQKSGGSGTSIYDCFNWFGSEETLTGNDKWYCPKCKNHQNALKKMEVYKCPEYLIIHLKRFSHQRQSFFSSRKITDLIDFPVEGLDLSEYVLSHKPGSKEKIIYDLYAVSNHFGSLNGGHYTAYC